jgi:hypothetical protein
MSRVYYNLAKKFQHPENFVLSGVPNVQVGNHVLVTLIAFYDMTEFYAI